MTGVRELPGFLSGGVTYIGPDSVGEVGQVMAIASISGNTITLEHADNAGGGGGVTDHGALTGLADDDHSQYHNDARGDARYYTQSQVTTLLANYYTSAQVDTLLSSYYDSSEVDALLATKAAASHTHTLSDVTDAGTSAALNVPATGDAAAGEVVKGNDTRLADSRTPTSHTHTLSEITDAGTAAASATGDFATAAQGAKADSALQPASIASGTITARTGAIDFSGGSDGDVLTVQADGSLAPETPAAGGAVDAHDINSFRNQITVRFDLLNASAGGTGSGTGNALTSRRSYTSSGTTAGSSYCRSVHNQEALALSAGKNADVINWSNRVSLSVLLSPIGETTNGVDRIYLGGDDVTTAQDIPAKGIGFHRKNDAIYGVCRNGGALTEVDLSVSLPTSTPKACAVTCDSDGAGNVTWYADGVQVGTSSAGPTGDGTASHCCFHQSSSNGADAAMQSCFVHDAVAVLDV